MAGFDGGSNPIMEWYALTGLATMMMLTGFVGLSLAKDERLLRRKIPMI
jgi:hypothetical protein